MKDDFTLLAAARTMNEEALKQIFDLYSPFLFRYAFRLSHNEVIADQIVGDVFAKLLDQMSAGKGPVVSLRPYLYEMVYHLFVNEVRYYHRRASLNVLEVIFTDRNPTSVNAENQDLFMSVLRAIRNDLTEDQRHVIILRFLEGFSIKETALIIGKNVGNVKVIQTRAIAVLRKALDFQIVETKAISYTIRSMQYI